MNGLIGKFNLDQDQNYNSFLASPSKTIKKLDSSHSLGMEKFNTSEKHSETINRLSVF